MDHQSENGLDLELNSRQARFCVLRDDISKKQDNSAAPFPLKSLGLDRLDAMSGGAFTLPEHKANSV
jgi:hypothetical protein